MDLAAKLNSFFTGLDAGIKSLKKVRSVYDESMAFDFNSVNFFNPGENKTSEILAFFLNPKENHGQNDSFLRCFLEHTKSNEALKGYNENPIAEIMCEHKTDLNRRIDIVIKLGGEFWIGIENKIWAADQKDQLGHYADYLRKVAGEKFNLFYLSPYGGEPSEYSITKEKSDEIKDKLGILSYERDIINLFHSFESICKADNVRFFIKDFNKYFKKMFLGEMFMDEQAFMKEYIEDKPEIWEYIIRANRTIENIKYDVINSFFEELKTDLEKFMPTCVWGNQKNLYTPNIGFKINSSLDSLFTDQKSGVVFEYRPNEDTFFIGIVLANKEASIKPEIENQFNQYVKQLLEQYDDTVLNSAWWLCTQTLLVPQNAFMNNSFVGEMTDLKARKEKVKEVKNKILGFLDSINKITEKLEGQSVT